MSSVDKVVRELLKRRDPSGFYVVPARRGAEAFLEGFTGVEVVEAGDILLIRVKSRRVAEKLAARLARLGLLAV